MKGESNEAQDLHLMFFEIRRKKNVIVIPADEKE